MIGGSCHIPLKDVYIAGIIGKGGVIIKDICARSGATVRVSQRSEVNASGERTVIIEGSPDKVAAAETMVRERCRTIDAENQAKGGGAGGGYGGYGGGRGGGRGGAHGGAHGSGGSGGYIGGPAYGGGSAYGGVPPSIDPSFGGGSGYIYHGGPGSCGQPATSNGGPGASSQPSAPAYQPPPPGYSFAP